MAFPTRLLAPGEEVVSETHPSWSVLARPILLVLAVIAACVGVVVSWGSAPSAVGYGLAAASGLATIWLVGQMFSWRSRLLVVTTRRVIYRWGIVQRTGREIPLERVQDVTYHQTLMGRLTRAGSLTIESAGTGGREPFPSVRHPAEMQSLINQLISMDTRSSTSTRPYGLVARRQRISPLQPTSDPTVTAEMPRVAQRDGQASLGATPTNLYAQASSGLSDQLRTLEQLHEEGVITDAEFLCKRAELLELG
ncbi:MAG: SHOCT domain-containing protein [Acidimicrobiales bacterium]